MTNQHPITPPQELLDKWNNLSLSTQEIFVIVAQWGADQELEATDAWIRTNLKGMLRPANRTADDLRAARRPKPPSLKEQALEALVSINANFHVYGADIETIRRALEALPE